MNTAQASKDEWNYKCFICSGSYKNPKSLPCSHKFCEIPCTQGLLNSANGNTFRCPLCRLEFPVPPNGTTAFTSTTNVHHISSNETAQSPKSNNRSNTCSDLVIDGSDTRCSVCLSDFRNPKILPCTHNLCEEPCLRSLLNSASGNTFRCPLCRQEFYVPSTGTRAFPYNRNFPFISPTRTEIPIRSPLVQCHHLPLGNAQANQRAAQGTHRQDVEIRRPGLLIDRHVTTSCCSPLCCKDYMKKLCFIAFLVYYVGASLARIGIISYLFWVENVWIIHYTQLAQCIINILIALATLVGNYIVAKILSWIVFTILIFGLSVFVAEWECLNEAKNCYDFVLTSRFFCICDLFMFVCFTVFLKKRTNRCCCCNCY